MTIAIRELGGDGGSLFTRHTYRFHVFKLRSLRNALKRVILETFVEVPLGGLLRATTHEGFTGDASTKRFGRRC